MQHCGSVISSCTWGSQPQCGSWKPLRITAELLTPDTGFPEKKMSALEGGFYDPPFHKPCPPKILIPNFLEFPNPVLTTVYSSSDSRRRHTIHPHPIFIL